MNFLRVLGKWSLWTRCPIHGVTSSQRLGHALRPECTTVFWRPLSSGAESRGDESDSNRRHHDSSAEAKERARMFTLATAAATAALGGMYVLYRQLSAQGKVDEEAEVKEDGKDGDEVVANETGQEEESAKKHVSFHDRRMMNYEDRIRAYSTPEKIFRYFATVKILRSDGSFQIYMTPDDFFRCITPGILQPQGYGLDNYRTMPIEKWMKEQQSTGSTLSSNGVLSRMGRYGLISYFDFLFLLTILATPMRNFELAFKMFDLNGDGDVELKEFEKVKSTLASTTGHAAAGVKSKNPQLVGKGSGGIEDGLITQFFGENKDKKLTVQEFRNFHEALRMEVLQLEFNRFEPTSGCITEKDFAKLVLTAAVNSQAMKKYLKRVQSSSQGITFEEVQQFAQVLDCLNDVETALSMYSAAGASVTQAELKHVVKAVSGIQLSDHLVDTVFTLFDENGDGQLSHSEFIKVLKSRRSRGLDKSSSVGFMKFVRSAFACSIKITEDKLGMK